MTCDVTIHVYVDSPSSVGSVFCAIFKVNKLSLFSTATVLLPVATEAVQLCTFPCRCGAWRALNYLGEIGAI